MRTPLQLLRFLARRIDRRRLDREMDEEMALHIELHAQALERQGISAADAARRARAEFGGVQRYREEGREARVLSWIHDLAGDLRYGARALRRSPWFTATAVASLALGIGATTAVFGLVYAILMQPLAVARPGELAALAFTVKGEWYAAWPRSDFAALHAMRDLPELQAVNASGDVAIEAGDVRDVASIDFVEGGYFALLGVRPLLGRVISTDDDYRNERVVLLSEDLWQRMFARRPDVLGQTLVVKSQPFTVIGVLPRSFRGILFNWRFQLAVPQSAAASLGVPPERSYVHVVTRVSNADERAVLGARLDAALRRCCFSDEDKENGAKVVLVDASRGVPFSKNDFRDEYRRVLWLLMAAVGLVLVIACSNVGNLLLARAAAREREFAARLSIGASRGRVVRQLLTEGVLLAALGAATGVAVAAWATGLLVRALPDGFETTARIIAFGAKPAVLSFAAAVAALCVVLCALGPALRATRPDLVSSLKGPAGRRRGGTSAIDRLVVVGQVALTMVLLSGAWLLAATLRNLRNVDPGFASDHRLIVSVETRATSFERDGIVPIHQELLDRVRALPGVTSAAMASRIPAFGGRISRNRYSADGPMTAQSQMIDIVAVTPGFFATAGTRVVSGRDVHATDTQSSTPVAVVNEAFVRRHFAATSPLGRQVRMGDPEHATTMTVIGVVQDVRFDSRRRPQDPMLYLPVTQSGQWPFLVLMVQTAAAPANFVAPVDRAIASYSRELRLRRWQSMDDAFNETILRERLAAWLASVCAAIALALAMVGLSGLVGFSVSRRTREIGVRLALGAQRPDVLWMVLRGALSLVAIGIAIGLPMSLVAGRAFGSLIYGIAASNLFMLAGAAAALLLVGAAATALPALRASRVDPATVLRLD